ncbi:Tat pathway signal sequence domain protein, partial [Streptomyces sp. LP11]|nr:Tat pathway signal sequence domain protein [Streptomyces sp. LP11]
MSGVGPVEPGEGTRAWDEPSERAGGRGERGRGSPRSRCGRHRRMVLAGLALAVLLGGVGLCHATRARRPAHASPPAPQVPYPAQAVDVTYLDGSPVPARGFRFTVLLSVASGAPVTVTRVTQPYAGLSLRTEPPAPFRTVAGSARKITISAHVTDCGKAPRNAGLPFLDVTLRNARAIQTQSFILGDRY